MIQIFNQMKYFTLLIFAYLIFTFFAPQASWADCAASGNQPANMNINVSGFGSTEVDVGACDDGSGGSGSGSYDPIFNR